MQYGKGCCIQFVGKPGMGKDTFIRAITERYPKRPVINFSTKPSTIRGKSYFDFKEFKGVAQKAQGTIIVMNELDSYLLAGRPEPGVIHIQANAREYNNLVIMVWHGWQQIGKWTIPNTYGIRRWDSVESNWTTIHNRFAAIAPIINSLRKTPHLPDFKSIFIPLR